MAVYKTNKGTVRTGADRKGGSSGSSKSAPTLTVSPTSSGLTAQQSANELAAQKTRFGVSQSTPVKTVAHDVITAEKMKKQPQMNIPTPPVPQGMTSVTDSANAALAGASGGTYDAKTKQIVPAPTPVEQPMTALDEYRKKFLGDMADNFNAQTTQVDYFKQSQKMLKPKENVVNSLQGQLNTITSNRDAQMLSLEGQGRGQSSSFVGGEQARISREAAIQAMPVQAQLAIAQDDLESARSYASQLFQAQSQDAQARYAYQKDMNASIFSFLNEDEKRKMATKEREEDRAFSVEQTNRNTLKQLSMQAIEYGQGALAGEIMRLDSKSPTFDQDYADVTSRLRKPVAASGAKAPDLQNFGTSDTPDWRQYNPTTGSWDEVDGVGGGTGSSLSKVQKAKISTALVSNEELYKDIGEYKALLDQVGFEGTTWGAKNLGKYDALRGRITTTLKKAETLGTLDAGVIQLVEQLIGKTPEKGGFTQNFLGFGADRISSGLETQLRLIKANIDRDKSMLGGNSFSLDDTDITELNDLFGVTANTTEAFDPANYF